MSVEKHILPADLQLPIKLKDKLLPNVFFNLEQMANSFLSVSALSGEMEGDKSSESEQNILSAQGNNLSD